MMTEPFALFGDLDFWIKVPEALRRSWGRLAYLE